MKKIAVISIENINNIGDNLLGENTEYLINKCCKNAEVEQINLQPNRKELGKKYLLNMLVAKILFIISNRIPSCDTKYILKNWAFKIKMRGYFQEILKNTDKIIYAIGMLKYSTQDQSYTFELINNIAKQYNIHVMMSAMSIEKYNENDWRCRQLVRAVNNPIVKCITTRDTENELSILRDKYLHKDTQCITECVGDPALWTAEAYNVKSKNCKSDLIGIGLIRLGIYKDYGYGLNEKELFNLYINIIKELELRKKNWVLFCNGMSEDYEVGIKLLKELNLPKSKLLQRPTSPLDLINILQSFKCVMGARLHSCITSYALGIPVVGLVWDNKLRAFAKKIEWERYFIEKDNLNAKYIVDKLEEVNEVKYDKKLLLNLKQTIFKTIGNFCYIDNIS